MNASFAPAPTLADWRLLVQAFLWIVAMRLALPVFGLPASLRFAGRPAAGRSPPVDPRRAARAVDAVANRLPGTRCVARALALHALLRRSSHDSEVHLGVAASSGAVAAHMWVTCAGQTLLAGASGTSYRTLQPRKP